MARKRQFEHTHRVGGGRRAKRPVEVSSPDRVSPLASLRSEQQVFGNQGVLRRLQAKLTVNQPGDVYEQEAERVADSVMSQPASGSAVTGPVSMVAASEPVQREHAGGKELSAGEVAAAPVIEEALSSPGQALDRTTRSFMESKFGCDFSQVRVHTDATAQESAAAVQAHAYTVGPDIVFGPGQYRPHEAAGQRLVAHELAHVVQQSGLGHKAGPGKGSPTAVATAGSIPTLQRQPKGGAGGLAAPSPTFFAAADPEAAKLLSTVMASAGTKTIPTGTQLVGGTLPGGGKIKFVFAIDPGLGAFGKTTVGSVSSVGQAGGEIVLNMTFQSSAPTQQTWFHEFQHALILISQELFKDASQASGASSPAAIAAMTSSRTAGKYWADMSAAALLPESQAVATSYGTFVGAARKAAGGAVNSFSDGVLIEHVINERRAYLEEYAFVTANKKNPPSAVGLPGIIAGTVIAPLKAQLSPAEQAQLDATDSQLGLRADLEATLTRLFGKLPT